MHSTSNEIAAAVLLFACAPCGSSVADSDIPSITIEGGGVEQGVAATLSADVPQSFAALSLSVNSSDYSIETQKCGDLLEIAASNFDGIFSGAVSSLVLSITLSESRDLGLAGEAWKRALTGFAKSGSVEFDLKGASNYIPSVESLSFDVEYTDFSGKQLSKYAQAFLQSRFAAFVQTNFSEQSAQFVNSGIIRVQSDDQALVCYAVLAKQLVASLAVKARTFDRLDRVEILQPDCVLNLIRKINEDWASGGPTFKDLTGQDQFNLMFGYELATNAGSKSKLFGSGKPPDVCAVDSSEPSLATNQQALSEWAKAAKRWFDIGNETGSLRLTNESIDKFSGIGEREDFQPTFLLYTYRLDAAPGGK